VERDFQRCGPHSRSRRRSREEDAEINKLESTNIRSNGSDAFIYLHEYHPRLS
jgi:hypothetical protein